MIVLMHLMQIAIVLLIGCRFVTAPTCRPDGDCAGLCASRCTISGCYDDDTRYCIACQPGYTGNYCTEREDSSSTVDSCPSTYWGDNCDKRCSSNCLDRLCNRFSGGCKDCPPGKKLSSCDEVCDPTTYGQNCRERCSTGCGAQLCDPVTGKCDRCIPGKTGDMCDIDCPHPTYGQDCLQTCSTNCADQLCNPVDGTCDPCVPGKTGDMCDQNCSHPTYGQDCAKTCSTNCVGQRCNPVNGICDQCPPGKTGDICDQDCPALYHGARCTELCSTNCVDRICDSVTGVCDQCPPQKTGDQCDQDAGPNCPPTYYDENCQSRCSSSCVNQLCDENNGTCSQCPSGKTGDQCETACSPTTYGERCAETCSVNCLDQLCDSVSGTCLKCPQRYSGDQCDQELCPEGFCTNGAKCTGRYLCDCSSTDFYGDRCQYSREQIPITDYIFINIVNNIIITTSGNMTATGNVTLDKDGDEVSVKIPAGNYLTTDEPILACLDDIDNCGSGFTITVTHSFSPLDKTGTQVVLTTGAGLEDGVRGVSLYYQNGTIYCFVVTSTQVWSIVQPFHLVENEVYKMTVSWHVEQGLVLLQGNNVIGSSEKPSQLTQKATTSKPLLIGTFNFKESTTVMNVKNVVTILVFWKEIQRSGVLFTTESSSDSSALEIAQIVGIAIGCFAVLVLAVVGLVFYIKRNCGRTSSPPADVQEGDGYQTPGNENESVGSSHAYAYYNKESSSHDKKPPDYDYIDSHYVKVEP